MGQSDKKKAAEKAKKKAKEEAKKRKQEEKEEAKKKQPNQPETGTDSGRAAAGTDSGTDSEASLEGAVGGIPEASSSAPAPSVQEFKASGRDYGGGGGRPGRVEQQGAWGRGSEASKSSQPYSWSRLEGAAGGTPGASASGPVSASSVWALVAPPLNVQEPQGVAPQAAAHEVEAEEAQPQVHLGQEEPAADADAEALVPPNQTAAMRAAVRDAAAEAAAAEATTDNIRRARALAAEPAIPPEAEWVALVANDLRWDLLNSTLQTQSWITFLGEETLGQRSPRYRINFKGLDIYEEQKQTNKTERDLYICVGSKNVGHFDPETGWYVPTVAVAAINIPLRSRVYCFSGTRMAVQWITFCNKLKVIDYVPKHIGSMIPTCIQSARNGRPFFQYFEWSVCDVTERDEVIRTHFIGCILSDPNLWASALSMGGKHPFEAMKQPGGHNHRLNIIYGINPRCGTTGPNREQRINRTWRPVHTVKGTKKGRYSCDPDYVYPVQGCVFFNCETYATQGFSFWGRLQEIRGAALDHNVPVWPSSAQRPWYPPGGRPMTHNERVALKQAFNNVIYQSNHVQVLTINARQVNTFGNVRTIIATNHVQVPWVHLVSSRLHGLTAQFTTSYMTFFPSPHITELELAAPAGVYAFDFAQWALKTPPRRHCYQYWIVVGSNARPFHVRADMRQEPQPYFVANNLPVGYSLFAVSGVQLAPRVHVTNNLQLLLMAAPTGVSTRFEEATNYFSLGHTFRTYGPSQNSNVEFLNCVLEDPARKNYIFESPERELYEVKSCSVILSENHPRNQMYETAFGERFYWKKDGDRVKDRFYELDAVFNDALLHEARKFGTQILSFGNTPQDLKWADTLFHEDLAVELLLKPRIPRPAYDRPILNNKMARVKDAAATATAKAHFTSAFKSFDLAIRADKNDRPSQLPPGIARVRLAFNMLEKRRSEHPPFAAQQVDRRRLDDALDAISHLTDVRRNLRLDVNAWKDYTKALTLISPLSRKQLNQIEDTRVSDVKDSPRRYKCDLYFTPAETDLRATIPAHAAAAAAAAAWAGEDDVADSWDG